MSAPIFVHSRLDDYGLSPQEFRVYCHLARRAGKGAAFPSVREIARVCQLHPQTARRCLKVLIIHRLITREERSGTTPLYRLTPPSQWQPPTHIHGDPCETNTHPSHSSTTIPKAVQATHSEIKTDEGIPLIQNPLNPPKGESVNNASVSSWQAEEIYAAYPKKVGKPAALRAIRRALVKRPFEFLLERTRLFATTYNGESRFIPHPAKWFDQERFNDDPATWRRADTPTAGLHNKTAPSRRFHREDCQQPFTNL